MSITLSPAPRTSVRVPCAAASRFALSGVMLIAAAARLWHLGDAGFGTEYYAAAGRSMLSDPHNLLYGAFDPAGVLAIDKPPAAFWIQAASAELLGYGPFALMLPQAIEGCLSVAVLWCVVRRDIGETAAILAALFLGPDAHRHRRRPVEQHRQSACPRAVARRLGHAAPRR